MSKRTIVFSSSSESSDSDGIQIIPQAKKPTPKITLESDYSYEEYEDADSSSDEAIEVKQPIHPVRQARPPNRANPAARILKKPSPARNVNRGQNQNQSKAPIKPEAPPHVQNEKSSSDDKKPKSPTPSQPSQNPVKPPRPPQQSDTFEIKGSDDEDYNEEESSGNDVFEINPALNDEQNGNNNEELIPTSLELPTRRFPMGETMKTFAIQRTKKHSIKGKSYIFSLFRNSDTILYSKCVSRHPKGTMPISTNPDVHMKGSSEYSIASADNCRHFVIRSATQTIMTYEIEIPTKVPKLPRLTVTIDPSFDFEPKKLVSKRPTMSRRGFWFLDFHNKFTLPSEKNAIFTQGPPDSTEDDLVIVRKISKDRIEIDCNLVPSEVVIFGIGLVAFLAKLK